MDNIEGLPTIPEKDLTIATTLVTGDFMRKVKADGKSEDLPYAVFEDITQRIAETQAETTATTVAAEVATETIVPYVEAAQLAETNAQTHETNAGTHETNAQTAQTASEAARDLSIAARDLSIAAKVASESARDGSVSAKDASIAAKNLSITAQGLSEAARDLSITAKNDSVIAKNASVIAQGLSEAARDLAISAKNFASGYADTAQTQAGISTAQAVISQAQAVISTTQAGIAVAAAASFPTTHPEIAYKAHVTAESGTIQDPAFAQRVFDLNKNILTAAQVNLLIVPSCGMVESSGASRVFNMADAANDLVFNTNKWTIGGAIAPNEKKSLKGVTGLAAASLLLVTPIVKADNASWTLLFRGIFNGYGRIYFGTSYLEVSATEIILHNGTDAVLTGTHALVIGMKHTIEFRYSDATGVIIVDRVSVVTVVADKAITFSGIIYYATSDMGISYLQINSRVLSAYESKLAHDFLDTEFPAIETITVGSQQVATSNLEATVFGGVAIPEVQVAADWAALSTKAWAHYDNSAANGAIYGKIYNGFARAIIATYGVNGYHVGSALEWAQLSAYLGGDTVSGGKMKAKYGGFNSAFSSNESGVSLLAAGKREINGTFTTLNSYLQEWAGPATVRYSSSTQLSFNLALTVADNNGFPIRLFSNTPHLLTDTYTSGLFATDIASGTALKSIRIPFNSPVKTIKIKSTTSLTNIEAKLYSYDGTELETLITGKACNATTKSFNVTVDQTMSYTDCYVRVTATGNSGVGCSIDVII